MCLMLSPMGEHMRDTLARQERGVFFGKYGPREIGVLRIFDVCFHFC